MRRFLALAAVLLAAPGCLVHRWSATPSGRLLAGYTGNSIVVADGDLKSLETYPAPGKPAVVEISPDGKWVLYNTEDANELWLVDRTAKTQKQIAKAEGGVYAYNAWSPTSTRFAFVQKEHKKGSMDGMLRVYNVKTGEAFTAIEDCVPAYSWTPSGDALFAVEPWSRKDDSDSPYGRLVYWTDGVPVQTIAHLAGFTFVEAVSEDEVLFTSAIATLPCPAGKDPFKDADFGLFRASRSTGKVSRAGSANIGWMTLSPDRTLLLAFVVKRREGGGEPEVSLEMFDAEGKSVRVLKDAAAYRKGGPLLPMWIGPQRVLVPLGENETQTFEVQFSDGSAAAVVVTDKIKAWAK